MLLNAPLGHRRLRFVGVIRQQPHQQRRDGFAMTHHTINFPIRRRPGPKAIHFFRSGDETIRRITSFRYPTSRLHFVPRWTPQA